MSVLEKIHYDLGKTATYASREAEWIPGEDESEGHLILTLRKGKRAGSKIERDTYQCQMDADGSFLLLNLDDPEQKDVYRTTATSCTCDAGRAGKYECKHLSFYKAHVMGDGSADLPEPGAVESVEPHQIDREFILAGKAIFTIAPPAAFVSANGCPDHWTYRVTRMEPSEQYPNESYLIGLLVGPDNQQDYQYLGKLIPSSGTVQLTKASHMTHETLAVKVLSRVLARVWSDDLETVTGAGWTVQHAGRCARCAKVLTTPLSVSRGYGPECWGM